MSVCKIIETQRLCLRQWNAADFVPFAAMNRDSEVMKFFPALLTRQESDALASRIQALIAEKGWGFWAVETKADARFIGFVGLNSPGYNLPFSPCTEIGWRLMRSAWGQGYATEAGLAALRFGFQQLELNEIVSFCVRGNSRSYAVMRRLGMYKQIDTFAHPLIDPESPLSEHYLYKISRSEWLDTESDQKS